MVTKSELRNIFENLTSLFAFTQSGYSSRDQVTFTTKKKEQQQKIEAT